jgi:hypothetical protein
MGLPAGAWWGRMTEARGRALARGLGEQAFAREHSTGESLRLEDALAAAQDAIETPQPGATR